jgi:hypothetical protein
VIEDIMSLPDGDIGANSLQFVPRIAEQEALMARPEVCEHPNGGIRKHYEAWADQPIPALSGKTPRQASRTPAGRKSVEALLAQFKRDESRLDPKRDPSILASLRAAAGIGLDLLSYSKDRFLASLIADGSYDPKSIGVKGAPRRTCRPHQGTYGISPDES